MGDAKFAERFTREAQALAALNHPNIVTIHNFGQAGGFYFLLMEFVDGLNLRQLLQTRKFTPEEALTIVPSLCDALQFAHDRGIVHRDIKPENILLDKTGRVKVADFGIAKMLGAGNGGATTGEAAAPASATQSTLGTPGYSAPEQKTDPQRVDSRADIYSLGVVFYELLTGELPGKPLQPPSKKVQIDVRLDEVVLRALEQKPELRYQQASVLKTQLETIATSAAPGRSPNQAEVPQPFPKWLLFRIGLPKWPARPASAAGPGATPATPPPPADLWQQLKARFWPPLVVRRNGRRVIHWPAVALGVIRSLLGALVVSVALVMLFGQENGSSAEHLSGAGLFVFFCLIAGGVMVIYIFHGFALPMNLVPSRPADSARWYRRSPGNSGKRSRAGCTGWRPANRYGGDRVRRGVERGTRGAGPPQPSFPRTAIIGACWIAFLPITLMALFFAKAGAADYLGAATLAAGFTLALLAVLHYRAVWHYCAFRRDHSRLAGCLANPPLGREASRALAGGVGWIAVPAARAGCPDSPCVCEYRTWAGDVDAFSF